jgi:hypothetical protein
MLNKLKDPKWIEERGSEPKRGFNSNSMVIKFTVHSEVELQLFESGELQIYAIFP